MLRSLLSLFGRRPVAPAKPQFGALPYRIVDGEIAVLLITSRGRGQWIFPKGRAIAGKTPWESAAIEAHEEAGVKGEIEETPIGSYVLPVTLERPTPVEVKIFPLLVTRQCEQWAEMDQRERRWAGLAQAEVLITHEGLADVALALARRELGKTQTS